MWVVLGGFNGPDHMYVNPQSRRDTAIHKARSCCGYMPWSEIRRDHKLRCVPVTVSYTLPPSKQKRKACKT